MKLTYEQQRVVDAALTAENPVFITGGAGTGKSVILRHIREELSRENVVYVAAPTGMAAENVAGVTVHSMFGLPTNRGAAVYDQFSRKEKYNDVATQMDVLLIDEVSMVRADIMNQIDKALQYHRNSDRPFGGVKVILFGDPYQLAPILKWEDLNTKWDPYGHKYRRMFATNFFFSARVIMNSGLQAFELKTSMRAAEDQPFVDVLNRIRVGKGDIEDLAFLINNSSSSLDLETSTHLYGKNDKVAERNQAKLQELPAESERTFRARWIPNYELNAVPIRDAGLPESDSAEIELTLRVGARVLFTRNNGEIWRNGSLGTVVKFSDGAVTVQLDKDASLVSVEKVNFDVREMVEDAKGRVYGDVTGWYEQFPLKLGWALTVHKAQGQTLDSVILDFDEQYFAEGQAYVALSRARTISSIRFINPPKLKDLIEPNAAVKGFLSRFGIDVAKSNAELDIEYLFGEAIDEAGYDYDLVKIFAQRYAANSALHPSVQAVQAHIVNLHQHGGVNKVIRFIEVVLLGED